MQPFRVFLIDEKKQILNTKKTELELYLSKIFPLSVTTIKEITQIEKNVDLILHLKNILDVKHAERELRAIMEQLTLIAAPITPIIFISDSEPSQWENLTKSTALPWVFDLLHPAHTKYLPIRVANLLRMREQLIQLKQHKELMESLTQRILSVEESLRKKNT